MKYVRKWKGDPDRVIKVMSKTSNQHALVEIFEREEGESGRRYAW